MAGPVIRRASGRATWSMALACTSSPAGTRSGTRASNAGPKKAVAAPYTATRGSTCHRRRAPVAASTPSRPTATARTASEAIMTRRRSKRSLTTPPTSSSATWGMVMATPTTEKAAGAFDSW